MFGQPLCISPVSENQGRSCTGLPDSEVCDLWDQNSWKGTGFLRSLPTPPHMNYLCLCHSGCLCSEQGAPLGFPLGFNVLKTVLDTHVAAVGHYRLKWSPYSRWRSGMLDILNTTVSCTKSPSSYKTSSCHSELHATANTIYTYPRHELDSNLHIKYKIFSLRFSNVLPLQGMHLIGKCKKLFFKKSFSSTFQGFPNPLWDPLMHHKLPWT